MRLGSLIPALPHWLPGGGQRHIRVYYRLAVARGALRLRLRLQDHMWWLYSWFWGFDSFVPGQPDSDVPEARPAHNP